MLKLAYWRLWMKERIERHEIEYLISEEKVSVKLLGVLKTVYAMNYSVIMKQCIYSSNEFY
jgi:hypothetical protein